MENEALKILDAYHRAVAREQVERDLREKFYAYYNNRVDDKLGQWPSDVRSKLEAQGKPAISFNEIKKFINLIYGIISQMRVDQKAFPRDDAADSLVAETITDLIKYVKDINKGNTKALKAFKDCLIGALGFQKVEWSDELDPLGEITIKDLDPASVYVVGKGREYDLSDRKAIIEVLPMDKEEIQARWPDKKKDVEGLKTTAEGDDKIPVADDVDYSFGKTVSQSDIYDPKQGKYLVLRQQKFMWRSVTFVVLPDGTRKETELKGKELKAAQEISLTQGIELKIIKKPIRKVRLSYSIGPVMLEDDWSPYAHNKFDIVPTIAFIANNFETGVVQDLIDPQDEKNKRHSQLIHILGTAAKNSYFAYGDIFDDIEDARKRMGGVGEIVVTKKPPTPENIRTIDSNLEAVPALANMDMAATQEMKEISGINDAAFGKVPSGVKSGRGIDALQAPTETVIGELVEHYLESHKLVAQLIVALIQQFYTSERKVRILGEFHPGVIDEKTKMMMGAGLVNVEDGAKTVTVNKPGEDGKPINDVTVGRYDIVLDNVSGNPTTRQARYMDLMNMKSLGAPVKWSTIIKASDSPGKMEALKDTLEVEQMAQMAGVPPQMAGGPPQANVKKPGPGDEMLNVGGVRN